MSTGPAFWLVNGDSLPSVSRYFIYFADIENVFLQLILQSFSQVETGYLVSRDQLILFFRYSFVVKAFFPPSAKLLLQQILYSGYLQLVLRIVETILFQFLKFSFYWKQFSHLVEIYFKRILYYGQWQRIFCLVERIFFHSYFF